MTDTRTRRTGPLARFKVLDLTRARAGPTAARQLADWGADVIKIEDSGTVEILGGGRHGSDFQNLQRNRRSITLNLKTEEGRAVLHKLVKVSDVVVENYRPDVKKRLGLDYETLRSINKRIVLGSISGFGQSGPYANRPGYDQIAQGMSGLMSVTGLPGQGPVRAGIAVADSSAGIYLSFGILAALLERETSGEGQWVHTSLLQALLALCDFQAARWTMDRKIAPQAGNDHPTGIPTGVFVTSDGHINIATSPGAIWERFCAIMGREDWKTDPRFVTPADRSKNRVEMNAQINAITKTNTSVHWVDALNKGGVPCGHIYSMDQVFADEQVIHNKMEVPVQHPKLGEIHLVNQPIGMSRTALDTHNGAPEAGEHTDEILAELGYDAAAIADLRARKAV
jgi:formyl-CoA transferase